jgi:tetratricopeptide (TPR) repeat protein
MKRFALVLLFAASLLSDSNAQLKLPALSPTSKITQDFSTSSIEISYSRPSMRGRKIFGDLVPYNTVWRTGANSATKVKFGEDVNLGGVPVKAGEYALYTIPGATEWEVILNKGTGNWGAMGYSTADDIARFKVKPRALDKTVNTFTMNIGNITFNSANLELMWEKTKLVIPIKAENDARLAADIDKAINKPNIPYYQAASYYYETNQNLDKAYDYVNKALEDNPKAFYMWHLKAKIAQKTGRKQEAIAAAQKSMELTKGTPNEGEYQRNNQKVIDLAKKM